MLLDARLLSVVSVHIHTCVYVTNVSKCVCVSMHVCMYVCVTVCIFIITYGLHMYYMGLDIQNKAPGYYLTVISRSRKEDGDHPLLYH